MGQGRVIFPRLVLMEASEDDLMLEFLGESGELRYDFSGSRVKQ